MTPFCHPEAKPKQRNAPFPVALFVPLFLSPFLPVTLRRSRRVSKKEGILRLRLRMTEKVQNDPLFVTLRRSRRVSFGDSSVANAPSDVVLSEAKEWQKKEAQNGWKKKAQALFWVKALSRSPELMGRGSEGTHSDYRKKGDSSVANAPSEWQHWDEILHSAYAPFRMTRKGLEWQNKTLRMTPMAK